MVLIYYKVLGKGGVSLGVFNKDKKKLTILVTL